MKKIILIPLYAEHIRVLLKRAGWTVTRIHTHYIFEQSCFKRDFCIMNQISKQNEKTWLK